MTPELQDGGTVLGQGLYEAALQKVEGGARAPRIGNWRPHFGVDIRGAGGGMYKLKVGATEIGTLSAHQQFREAYQRAIYMHSGVNYRVESVEISSDGGTIHLAEAPDHIRTNAFLHTTINVQNLFGGHQWEDGTHSMYGNVTVMESILSIREFDERSDETTDNWTPESNNATYSNAHAFWIQVGGVDDQMGVLELQHLLRLGTLFTIPVESHDVIPQADGRVQTAYLIESYAGGIGIARKVFERWREILETGIGMAESCECKRGCPNCIVPPRSKEDLDKRRGIALARRMLSDTALPHAAEFREGLWESV